MKLSPAVQASLRKVGKVCGNAVQATQLLANFRLAGGGPVAATTTILGGISAVISALVPEPSNGYDVLPAEGYDMVPLPQSLVDLVYSLVVELCEASKNVAGMTVHRHDGHGIGMLSQDGRAVAIYVKEGSRLNDAVMSAAWSRGRALELYYSPKAGSTLASLRSPDEVYGDPTPEDVAALFDGFGPRAILISGPSGAGKSVLARRAVDRLKGQEPRLLRINDLSMVHLTEESGVDVLVDVVKLLRPDVLLLDDVQAWLPGESGLSVLEALKLQNTSVVLTYMTNIYQHKTTKTEEELQLSRRGIRPGRVDAVIHVQAPATPKRAIILDRLLDGDVPDGLLALTMGYTGAYLKEVAERMRRGVPWRVATYQVDNQYDLNFATKRIWVAIDRICADYTEMGVEEIREGFIYARSEDLSPSDVIAGHVLGSMADAMDVAGRASRNGTYVDPAFLRAELADILTLKYGELLDDEEIQVANRLLDVAVTLAMEACYGRGWEADREVAGR